ncbi:MAG: helix-turn-helix domain-containing protein [Gemmataceae bacterium]
MAKKESKFSDQIRAAIDASELSRYRICKEIEIPESTMSRFMAGNCGLALDTLDRLAELLGLEIKRREK